MGITNEIVHRQCASENLLRKTKFFDRLRNKVAIKAFQVASYLNDPLSKSHESFRRIYLVDFLNPTSNKTINFIRKFSLFTNIILFGSLAIFTTIPAVVLRYFGSNLQNKSFFHLKGKAQEKKLPKDNSFNILSWNVCCIGGGYSISDGGVLPWSERIDKIVDKIENTDADVNCLFEVYDIKSAILFYEKLKKKYSHFYFNIGQKTIGVSSGILIFSKYKIKNPLFIKFPKDYLVGRTKNVEKGIFAFDLIDQENNFARIFSTHLQHSEQPSFPTNEEKIARKKQMELIIEKIKEIKNKAIIVTGDLNLDDDEYQASLWSKNFIKKVAFRSPIYTWGGDHFCAKMVGKKVSLPLNLDHTLALKNANNSIKTSLIDVGYKDSEFRKDALSDHLGLLSRITI